MATTSDRVLNIIAEVRQLGNLPDTNQRLLEDLNFDQFDWGELRRELEREFRALPDDVFSKFTTVAQIIDWAKGR